MGDDDWYRLPGDPQAADLSDICHFLVVLNGSHITRTSARDMRQYGCQKEDFDVFMQAYGIGSSAVDERLLLKLHFLEVTRRIISLSLRPARVGNRIFRFYAKAKLRRNAKRILKVLR